MNDGTQGGARIIGGSILVLIGGALLARSTGLLDTGPLWQYWPLILVAVGGVKAWHARTRHDQGTGVWLLLLGLWCAVWTLRIGGLTFADVWPAVFIALGVSLLWKNLPPISLTPTQKESPHGT